MIYLPIFALIECVPYIIIFNRHSDMDDQLDILLENTNSEFITLSFDDDSLISHPEQLSDECADMSK